MTPFDLLRRARLQALMARHLENWRDTWKGYVGAMAPAPLRFRNGTVLSPGPRGAPGFLFLEVFANRCYQRGVRGGRQGVVVDLGANVGAFSVFWAQRHPAVRIHAYEPDPDICAVLRDNVRANGLDSRVTVWDEAVCDVDGPVTFVRAPISIESGLRSGATGVALTVPAVTLRTVVERAGGSVSLLKMDVEGAEADILDAAAGDLPRIDEIIGEFHTWMVPDVIRRLGRILGPTHILTLPRGRHCGSLFHAARVSQR